MLPEMVYLWMSNSLADPVALISKEVRMSVAVNKRGVVATSFPFFKGEFLSKKIGSLPSIPFTIQIRRFTDSSWSQINPLTPSPHHPATFKEKRLGGEVYPILISEPLCSVSWRGVRLTNQEAIRFLALRLCLPKEAKMFRNYNG